MRYFTSDTHFGHARIIELCNRPFPDVEAMNETIVNNWNSVVTEGDEVFHLGDVALGPWGQWDSVLSRLNGYKILVVGNHDRLFNPKNDYQHDRWMGEYGKWFDLIVPEIKAMPVGGELVNLSHFPYDGDSHDGDRYADARVPDDGKTLIHGHTHLDKRISRSKNGTLQIHVGQDAWGYRPVSEEMIEFLLKEHR